MKKTAYRDGHSDTNKEQIRPEIHVDRLWIIPELMIQPIRNRTAQSKRDCHTRCRDADGNTPVANEKPQVGLQTNQKQEKHQPQISHEGQIGDGCRRENGIREARNPTHYGGAQQYASDDLCNHARLADFGKRPMQEVAEDDDDSGLGTLAYEKIDHHKLGLYLDDKDDNRILGVILGWITSFEDSSLRGNSLRARRTGGVGSSRRHGVGKMASVNVKRGGGWWKRRAERHSRCQERFQTAVNVDDGDGDGEVEMGRRRSSYGCG